MEWVRKAPEAFTLYARDPRHNTIIGGDSINPAPTYGCAFIDDWEGNRRRGTMEDYIKCLKPVEAEDVYKINGGIMIRPSDIPEESAAIEMFKAILKHSSKVIMLPSGYKAEMERILKAGSELFGGKEEFIKKPRMIALINTVSPLSLDERMLDYLMLLAEYGQAAMNPC